ncbi:MAG: hypothetical protein DHS20C01_36170 [marine bacterium B5-7]|nr:MAG: hypothetical protein DHS20C01_36170 [marine bacterium B5-7]
MTSDDEVDICVVGSGASGSVIAAELARIGYSVVILESGQALHREAIPTAKPDWEHRTSDFYRSGQTDPSFGQKDPVVYGPTGDRRFRVSRFRGVGGSTMHYEGFYTRIHPGDIHRRRDTGMGADWPIKYAELTPHYDRVEKMLGVSGALDNRFEPERPAYPNPAIAMSCAVKQVKVGCDRLGLNAAHAPLAIISRPAPGRGSCNFCGACWFGCMQGAISNASQTYIPVAVRHGARLVTGATVSRVTVDRRGRRADGVEYLDDNGALHKVRARRVVLCGNGIETPRLLLMSSRTDFPDGLANESGLVGRYFTAHCHVSLAGSFDHRINAYKGPNINGMVQDFWDHRDDRDFAGGYVIALRNAELGPYYHYHRHVRKRGLFGEHLVSRMQNSFGHGVNISAYGEHFSSADDRVDLDPVRTDSKGLPVPRVTIRQGDNEIAMQQHMRQKLDDILQASGAHDIRIITASGNLGTHLLGTCRMGSDPKTSVTDASGKTHQIEGLYIADGSLFPTTTPANPTLTIQALATRIAHLIARGDGRSLATI